MLYGNIKNNIFNLLLTVVFFVLVVVLGIMQGQQFIKMLPVLVTLFVAWINSRANKWGSMLGSINCIIYAIGFFSEGLFGSMASTLFISMPMQLATFFSWKKNAYKQARTFSFLSNKKRLLTLGSIVLLAAAAYIVMYYLRSANYIVIESITFSIGTIVSIMTIFGIIESQFLLTFSTLLNVAMWIMIIQVNPANITYLLVSVYNLIRLVQTIFRWLKLYEEQKKLTDSNV